MNIIPEWFLWPDVFSPQFSGMGTTSLQQLKITELEQLLMDETKKFTSALHDGTPKEQKDILRKRIDEIVVLLEKKTQRNIDESTAPERNADESTAPGSN